MPAIVIVGAFLALSCIVAFAQADATSNTNASPAVVAPAAAAVPDPLADYSGAAAACRQALQKAVALRTEGKWRSAYDALAAFDPDNKDPYALAMKTRLCLDGFVQTDQFQSFALKDLAKDQTLDAVRQNGGDAALFAFDPPALAAALSTKGVALPAVLEKVLGDYYYIAQVDFSGHWVMSDDDAYKNSLTQYQAAYAGGVFDADSLQNLGELLMRSGQGAAAAPIFQKSISLNPSNPTARYNYAICLIQQGDRKAALDQLDRAADLFEEPQAKFQTLSLAAHTSADLGDAARTESYIKKIETLDPEGPNAGLLRHEIAVTHKDPASANAAADALMARFAANPGVVRAIVSTWYANDGAVDARAFLERSIAQTQDDKSLGTLQFYLGILLAQGNPKGADQTAALAALDQATAHMKKVLTPDNNFFTVVAQVRAEIAQPAATGEAAPDQSAAPAVPAAPAAPAAPDQASTPTKQ
jgi:tetratricopeptide (TPR) repeat protein